MGRISTCTYHTLARPYHYKEFQRFFQSSEKPFIHVMKQPSDLLIYRGAYGLSLVGIFVSLYGVYCMANNKLKKASH